MLTTIAIAHPSPSTLDSNKIDETEKESNDDIIIGTIMSPSLIPPPKIEFETEWIPVTESGVISRTPRAVDNFKFPGEIFVECIYVVPL